MIDALHSVGRRNTPVALEWQRKAQMIDVTATAASLASASQISPEIAGLATILTSVSSSLVNLPLVYQQTRQKALLWTLSTISILIVLLGAIVFALMRWLPHQLGHLHLVRPNLFAVSKSLFFSEKPRQPVQAPNKKF
jgi:hypothetical protein